MNYIGKVITNVRDFYNDINAATLTGAIDVVVVEQPDGTFTCSPFHVRFGKLGVLRSREKVVDIEVNGEPLDIHMKLGESGEAFFVEEIPQSELEACPAHLACSPIPSEGEQLLMAHIGKRTPVASITSPSSPESPTLPLSTSTTETKTNSVANHPPLSPLHEAAQESGSVDSVVQAPQARTFRAETVSETKQSDVGEFRPIQPAPEEDTNHSGSNGAGTESAGSTAQSGTSKNARRKKRRRSMHKKKQQQMLQKKSSPGATGGDDDDETDQHSRSATPPPLQPSTQSSITTVTVHDDQEEIQFTLEDVAGPDSRLVVTTIPPCGCSPHLGGIMLSGNDNTAQVMYSRDCKECARRCTELGRVAVAEVVAHDQSSSVQEQDQMMLCTKPGDLHFFSDTEASPGHSVALPQSSSSGAETGGHDCLAPDLCDPYWAECSVLAPVATLNDAADPLTPHGSRAGSPSPQSDSELEMRRQSSAAEQTQLEAQLQAELGAGGKQSWKWGELPSPPPQLSRLHSTNSGTGTEQASNELVNEGSGQNKQQQQQQTQQPRSSMLSGVWSLMRSQNRQRASSQQEGVYLDELDVDTLDPEVAALYFPHSYRGGRSAPTDVPNRKPSRPSLTDSVSREEEDAESGKGPSLSQSPHSVEGAIGGPKLTDSDFEDLRGPEKKLFPDLALSLCGPLDLSQPPSTEVFNAAIISHTELRQNPSLLEHPALVVRMRGRLHTWREAAPEVLSLLIFQQPLIPEDTRISAETNLKQEECNLAAVAAAPQEENQVDNQVVPTPAVEQETNISQDSPDTPGISEITVEEPSQQGSFWFPWRRSGSNTSKKPEPANKALSPTVPGALTRGYRSSDEDELAELTAQDRAKDNAVSHIKEGEGYSGSNSSDESETGASRGINIPGAHLKLFNEECIAYRKTLRLSSEQITRLLLKEGANEVVFSVTTAYQGTSRCKCHVYRWRWDDKIVISDIDGTITKSDVLGHILPIVGKDWAQSGVAQLFTKIKNNGYRLLYLSARAIGQARVTREYLKSIKQGDLSLPEGPLLLSPTSLISAFHREVIEKKPEEFKISCLRDIQALFPPEYKPFYAGYGNKINDVWAYRAVGIPIFRIFTINHKGELKHELTQTFQSSYFGQSDAVDELFPPIVSTEYSNMSYIVDQMFPPTEDSSVADDFNSFNYWREPIPELDPALLPSVPASPTNKGKLSVKESSSASNVAK